MYFNSMRKNPENIDYNALMAHCLVKQHVVDPTYSGTDYENDLEKHFREGQQTGQGALEAPTFIDKQRGADIHERCTSMSAQEILDLP